MAATELIVKVSAPGKVILHGEHSVVYGKLAIAASLDLRTTVTLQERNNGKLDINFVDLKFRHKFDINEIKQLFHSQPFPTQNPEEKFTYLNPESLNHTEYVSIITKSLKISNDTLGKSQYSSLLSLLYLYLGIICSSDVSTTPLLITVKTNLSLGSGTGSSASLMVSLAGAFIHYRQLKDTNTNLRNQNDEKYKFTEQELNLISKWAFAAEKIIHGNPSGIDNTVCTYGSMVSFRKGRSPFAVKTSSNICGILIDTKVPKNTAHMIQKVVELRQRRPKVVDAIFDAMEDLTDEALEVLVRLGEAKEDNLKEIEICYEDLAELSRLNHDLLGTLGVSHPSLDAAVQILRSSDLPAKMTGAGGGGFAVGLRPPRVQDSEIATVCEKLQKLGFGAVLTKLGGDGVKIEQ